MTSFTNPVVSGHCFGVLQCSIWCVGQILLAQWMRVGSEQNFYSSVMPAFAHHASRIRNRHDSHVSVSFVPFVHPDSYRDVANKIRVNPCNLPAMPTPSFGR